MRIAVTKTSPDDTIGRSRHREGTLMIKVVQNDSNVPAGSYGEYLDSRGLDWELLPVDRQVPFPAPRGDDALMLLGGYMSVAETDRYPYLLQVKQGLQRWVAAARPVLGVCLGGQLLAEVMGGQVTRNHRGERGMQPIELTAAGQDDPLFAGIASPMLSMQWHNDSFALPPGAIHLAATETCPGQAFRVGLRAYGIQFHPELTSGIVKTWAEKLRLGEAPHQEFLAHEAIYRDNSLKLLENFLAMT